MSAREPLKIEGETVGDVGKLVGYSVGAVGAWLGEDEGDKEGKGVGDAVGTRSVQLYSLEDGLHPG